MSPDTKLTTIKNWLGSGSINILGIQFSGKDTLGQSLAKQLNGIFISSGDIVRAALNSSDPSTRQAALISQTGQLMPTKQFQKLIIPRLTDSQLVNKPLVLDSVGRWFGEENIIIETLASSQHPLKAAIILSIPIEEVWRRWEIVRDKRNGGRADDLTKDLLQTRIDEFNDKTLPLINKYRSIGLAIDITADRAINDTYKAAIEALHQKALMEV